MNVPTISAQAFEKGVLGSRIPVVVAFRAAWCRPSQELVPVIDEIAAEFDGRVKTVAVDFDAESAVCRRFRVSRVPVTMLIAGGRVADFIGGMTDKENITQMVERRLAPTLTASAVDFEREVLKSPLPTLVHFDAAWCEASRELVPLVDGIGKRFRGRAKVVRVEFGGDNAALCARYGIVRVPTIALFVDGRLEDQILGAMVGGTKVGDVQTSCVGLTSEDNITAMLRPFLF